VIEITIIVTPVNPQMVLEFSVEKQIVTGSHYGIDISIDDFWIAFEAVVVPELGFSDKPDKPLKCRS